MSNFSAVAPATLQRVLNLSGCFAKLTGQKLHAGKSKCWATSDGLREEVSRLTLDGAKLKLVDRMRCLGAADAVAPGAVGASLCAVALL